MSKFLKWLFCEDKDDYMFAKCNICKKNKLGVDFALYGKNICSKCKDGIIAKAEYHVKEGKDPRDFRIEGIG